MADHTAIEWTDATWTPVRAHSWEIQSDGSGKERIGWHCEHVSEGCRNCYAERINQRLGTGYAYKPGNLRGKPGYAGGGTDRPELFLDETMLRAPLRWKKPRMIFVCSMTDLFAEFIPDAWIDKVFAVMALAPQHTFQVPTKRPERMRDYVSHARDRVIRRTDSGSPHISVVGNGIHYSETVIGEKAWPLPNVWLGTSIEDHATADARVPELLATPAALRFVSAEPLLGPIDLTTIHGTACLASPGACCGDRPWLDALRGIQGCSRAGAYGFPSRDQMPRGLDWVIVGGESGPHARPMHPDLARSLRDQCQTAGVPFFMKQMSKKASIPLDLMVREWPHA